MPGKRWTPDEVAQLRDLVLTSTIDEIAVALGRSEDAVIVKMQKLKVKRVWRRTPDGGKTRYWTGDDDMVLLMQIGRKPFSEIAQMLGKTEEAVKLRASRKGWKARQGRVSLNDVAALIGIDPRTAAKYRDRARVKSRRRMGRDKKLMVRGMSDEDVAKIAQAILDDPEVDPKVGVTARRLREIVSRFGP